MQPDDLYGMLAFFSIFEILGGGALGSALRGVFLRQVTPQSFFFLIWGSGFAGIPLFIGAITFLSAGHPTFFLLEVLILGLSILIVALVPEDLFAGISGNTSYMAALIGAAMAVIGGGIVLYTVHQGIGAGLAIGGAVGAIGAVILLRAVVAVLHNDPN